MGMPRYPKLNRIIEINFFRPEITADGGGVEVLEETERVWAQAVDLEVRRVSPTPGKEPEAFAAMRHAAGLGAGRGGYIIRYYELLLSGRLGDDDKFYIGPRHVTIFDPALNLIIEPYAVRDLEAEYGRLRFLYLDIDSGESIGIG